MAQPQRKESQPRSVGHESIDGTLSGSVLQFNLASELAQLQRDEHVAAPHGAKFEDACKVPGSPHCADRYEGEYAHARAHGGGQNLRAHA